MGPRRVAYIWSEDLQNAADQLPSNLERSSVVHTLITALDLLQVEGQDRGSAHDNTQEDQAGTVPDDGSSGDLPRANVVRPDARLGSEENLKRYHDAKYVDYLMDPTKHHTHDDDDKTGSDEDSDGADDTSDSDNSYTPSERPAKRRRTEHGLEHDCPSFPALPAYARLVAAATQTACRELVTGNADIAICWDGGRHHAMRNRASGFCYVADVVLGIMALAKSGRPRVITSATPVEAPQFRQEDTADFVEAMDTPAADSRPRVSQPGEPSSGNGLTHEPARQPSGEADEAGREAKIRGKTRSAASSGPSRPPRRARIMYIDLDIHEGDGVHQAFLSPSRYPPLTSTKKPPKPPQVLTLSIHHHSRTFFPPHKPFSGLPDRETPSPFTLSVPLHAYASSPTYAAIWSSVEAVKASFDPDYVVLQLGLDGFPGDRVGQYGAWGTEGPGGLKWCVKQVMAWGLPLCVLGGGGYDNANAARGWAMVTAEVLGRHLDEDTHVPDHEHLPLYGPSFALEVPKSYARDENHQAHINEINDTFSHIARRIDHVLASQDA